jgi:hypothetical protein
MNFTKKLAPYTKKLSQTLQAEPIGKSTRRMVINHLCNQRESGISLSYRCFSIFNALYFFIV